MAPELMARDASAAAMGAASPTLLATMAQPRLLLEGATDAGGSGAPGGGFVSVMNFEWVLAPRGSAIDIRLPEETFVHRDRHAVLRWELALDSGQPLPAWLRFDPGERRLSGTAPPGTGRSMVVRVAVRDAQEIGRASCRERV